MSRCGLTSRQVHFFALFLVCVLGLDTMAGEDVPHTLARTWESLATLEFRSEDRIQDERGRLLRVDEVSFAMAPGGRRAYRRDDRRDGALFAINEVREDGRKLYQPGMFSADRTVTDSVMVRPQESPPDGYQGTMTPILWLILPGGKPLAAHLTEGASLEPLDPKAWSGIVVMRFPYRGRPLRCELDPAHDWLPRRMTLDGSFDTVVTQFGRDNGRWFPTACEMRHFNMPGDSGPRTEVVRVTVPEFHINRPIPDARFGMPAVGPGVEVRDMTTGRTRVEGGPEARRLLLERYAKRPSTAGATGASVVAEAPARLPLGSILAVVSLSLLAAVAFTRLRPRRDSRGFTMIEALTVVGVIGLILALMLPAIQAARESARRSACGNNLRQIALAVAGYHDQYGCFPPAVGWPALYRGLADTREYSFLTHILPQFDQGALYASLNFDVALQDPYLFDFAAHLVRGGPANRTVLGTSLEGFLCPSDGGAGPAGWTGAVNYRANIGADLWYEQSGSTGGPFGGRTCVGARDVLDGLSATVAIGEKLRGRVGGEGFRPRSDIYDLSRLGDHTDTEGAYALCRDQQFPPVLLSPASGLSWGVGSLAHTCYNHVHSPNSRVPDCAERLSPIAGLAGARSDHPGGIQSAWADGSVRFVTDAIDRATWRALGTRAGGEVLPREVTGAE